MSSIGRGQNKKHSTVGVGWRCVRDSTRPHLSNIHVRPVIAPAGIRMAALYTPEQYQQDPNDQLQAEAAAG
jgi:hypothetical protein